MVFITGTGTDWTGTKWGHFNPRGWAQRAECPEGCDVDHEGASLVRWHASDKRLPEIFIGGEAFARGPEQVLLTVLHEGAHGLAQVRGVKETSRGNRYHNGKFRELAEELGLVYTKDSPSEAIGYSDMQLSYETVERYASALVDLDKVITVYLDTLSGYSIETTDGGELKLPGERKGPKGGKEKGSRSLPKATCGCDTPRILRVAQSVLDAGPIVCGLCMEEFLVMG